MYEAIYRLVFGFNLAFMAGLMGFIFYVATAYVREYRKETDQKLRYRYLHVILLGTSVLYLFLAAVISLATTAYEPGSDNTIFFFPPGFIVMTVGLWALWKAGVPGSKRF